MKPTQTAQMQTAQTIQASVAYAGCSPADIAHEPTQPIDELMDTYRDITFQDALDNDLKRENANIDANTPMGAMLKYGSEGSKYYVAHHILPADIAQAHLSGDIHIHDMDFYMLTETCCQIDLLKLFSKGFSTGHGHLRRPNSIQSYAALACIAIQANQNDMHGGQAIPNFDFAMAPGVDISFRKHIIRTLSLSLSIQCGLSAAEAEPVLNQYLNARGHGLSLNRFSDSRAELADFLQSDFNLTAAAAGQLAQLVFDNALRDTEKETEQAMQALIHNLNTMNARAGAQVPFSSINYGTDTSTCGRMVMRCLLKSTRDGLGNGETPIFPVQIFKVKSGVNFEKDDPNYDLFRLAIQTSAERLFPNFSFLDAPFNYQYYRSGDVNTEVAYMGCRTRVMGNSHDPDRAVTMGRGNLSFTSINLPRLGIEARGDIAAFYRALDDRMALCVRQLLHRFAIQSKKTKRNYPFLMGEGVWLGSDQLGENEPIGDVLKHGTLSIGFIGLAETLKALIGTHHGASADAQRLGLEIIQHMRDFTDAMSEKMQLNFSLLATPAEGLSGRFVRMDARRFGRIEGVTDRDYYTNSFHVPVYHPISVFEKIQLEAPYHTMTNAGHISYVELDGDTAHNPEAFEAVIRCMQASGIGYGSVNHPVDRDPVCGYTGVISDRCPKCGRTEAEGPRFHRIRRITGYLVGTTDRFNDAKRSEEHDRVKHEMG